MSAPKDTLAAIARDALAAAKGHAKAAAAVVTPEVAKLLRVIDPESAS